MTRMPRILVATATYNERESLPYLFEAIQASVPTVDILVVDDNSPDGTGQWVDEQAANDPRIRVIHRSGKLGLGTATIAAFQYAIDQDYEFLVALDADGSHDPAHSCDARASSNSHAFAGCGHWLAIRFWWRYGRLAPVPSMDEPSGQPLRTHPARLALSRLQRLVSLHACGVAA